MQKRCILCKLPFHFLKFLRWIIELKGWGSVCWFVQSHFSSNLMGRHPPATSPPHRRFWIPLHRRSHSKYVPPGYASKFVQKKTSQISCTQKSHCLSHLRCFRPLRIQRKRSKPHGPHRPPPSRRHPHRQPSELQNASRISVLLWDSALQSAVVGVTWVKWGSDIADTMLKYTMSHEFLQVFAGLKAKMPKAFLIAARSCFLRHRISMACGFSNFGKSVVKTHAKTQTTGDWIKMSL